MGGKLFLHIGRNKAGSTTLQTAWIRHSDALLAAGVQYALFGQESPPGRDFPSFSSHMALAQYVQDRPSSSVLVSHEGLCCFHPDFAAAMAADLARLDVLLIFYVRPYRDWAVSDYVFNVLLGEQTEDFDAYLGRLGESVRFWPALKVWADAIGWDRVRVRSLHPDDLAGGDLALDGMAALGLTLPAGGPAPRTNASPAWISTELIRFLLTPPAGDESSARDRSIAEVLELGEIVDHGVRTAASNLNLILDRGLYLTQRQSAHLADTYNADTVRLAQQTGAQQLQFDRDGGKHVRKFLPSIDHVPRPLLQSLSHILEQKQTFGKLGEIVGAPRFDEFLALCV